MSSPMAMRTSRVASVTRTANGHEGTLCLHLRRFNWRVITELGVTQNGVCHVKATDVRHNGEMRRAPSSAVEEGGTQ